MSAETNVAELMARSMELQIKCLQEQITLLRGGQPPADSPQAESDGKKKKAKKVVDPNRPKKAVTAYQMFMKEEMPKIKLNHPQLTQREVLTLCAKEWQKCPPKKKEELDSAASVEKEKYKQNLETYEANLASGNTEQNSPPPVKKANKKVAAEKTQTAASDNKPKPLPTEAVADTDKDAKSHEKKRKKEKKSKKESSNSDGSSKKKKKSKTE